MNKNIVVIILIILAGAAIYFYGWPKLQPYLNTGGGEGTEQSLPGEGAPTPASGTPVPQP
jgi:hypothetical protein